MTLTELRFASRARELRDAYVMHQTLARFAEGASRPLWRQEGARVLVRTEQPFEVRHGTIERWGWRVEAPPLVGEVVEVRALVNAVRTCGVTRRRSPVVGGERLAWVERQVARCGGVVEGVRVRGEVVRRFRRGGAWVTLVGFEMVARVRVVDAGLWWGGWRAGWGKARGFGFGMPAPLDTAICPCYYLNQEVRP